MTDFGYETTEWGYARVSTTAQTLDAQLDALVAAGVDQERIVVEKVSGAKKERPELDALLQRVRAGDRITVWRLDRLGRSLSHLVSTVESLTQRGVAFRSLQEGIDASTASGRMTMHIFAALAEFERELNQERTRAALDAARARGKPLGRPSPITKEQAEQIWRLHAENRSQAQIARATGVSRPAVGRVLRGEIASLAHQEPRSEPDDAHR